MTPVTLELGGKSPAIVDRSADLDYTSIVSERHYTRLEGLVADAAARGARIMQAARPDETAWKSKRKFPPTIIVGATPDMQVMQEEIFGPLLPVLGYKDAAEPVAYINAHDRPLALHWFGKDDTARDEVLSRTISGGVTVNDCLFHFTQINQPMGASARPAAAPITANGGLKP